MSTHKICFCAEIRKLHSRYPFSSGVKNHFKIPAVDCIFVLEFNETPTLVGHFVSSPREREKRDSRDEREGQGRKRNRNKGEETEEIKKHTTSSLTYYKTSRLCPTVINCIY